MRPNIGWPTAVALVIAAAALRCSDDNAANHPPNAPYGPVPVNQAQSVPENTSLSWSGADADNDPLTFDVYFGTANPPPKGAAALTTTTYQPAGPLARGTTYFWKVVASDGAAATTGPLWSFKVTTGPEHFHCRYFPLEVGNTWTYEVTDMSMHGGNVYYDLGYEVVDTVEDYHGFAVAFVVSVKRDGAEQEQLYITVDEDTRTYVERYGNWLYLIRDAMAINEENDRGLVAYYRLEYYADVDVAVPAGSFPGSRDLRYRSGLSPYGSYTNCDEYYAADAGMVQYNYDMKSYASYWPHPLLDWRIVDYRLSSYELQPHPSR